MVIHAIIGPNAFCRWLEHGSLKAGTFQLSALEEASPVLLLERLTGLH
jgi:hypothetical protein